MKLKEMRYNEPVGVYEVIGIYMDETAETLDTATSYREAVYLTQEYQIAFGPEWSIYFTEI